MATATVANLGGGIFEATVTLASGKVFAVQRSGADWLAPFAGDELETALATLIRIRLKLAGATNLATAQAALAGQTFQEPT